MLPLGDDNGRCQIPSGYQCRFTNRNTPQTGSSLNLNTISMITQNPIIGRARKKLGGVYARTLYGKNVVQSCPPPKADKLMHSQIASCNLFAYFSRLSNQVPASLLNNIFYQAPIGRSRRAEWMRQLTVAREKTENGWQVNLSLITALGSNAAVTTEPIIIVPTSSQLRINFDEVSHLDRAIMDQKPCLILICKDTEQCIDLLSYTSLENNEIVLNNLSPTYRGHECYIYFLWQTNIGTSQNPILVYGSYQKIE